MYVSYIRVVSSGSVNSCLKMFPKYFKDVRFQRGGLNIFSKLMFTGRTT